MKDLDIKELDKYNFANFFKVINLGEKSYYNLYKTINFVNYADVDITKFDLYEVKEKDTWTAISYKYYNTIKLWWLICKFNNIKNPFTDLKIGNIIVIPKQQIVDYILLEIKNKK